MKFLKPLLIVVCLLPTIAYSQEEFFGPINGFNFSYAKINMFDNEAYGISLHSKNGILVGFTINKDIYEDPFIYKKNYLYGIAVGKMFELDKGSDFPAKPFASISYSWANANYLIANFGMSQCFFMNSPFAFSINGAMQLLTGLKKEGGNFGDFYPGGGLGFSLGYNQSFFRDKIVSPIAGVTFNFADGEHISAIHFGLNVNIGSINQD